MARNLTLVRCSLVCRAWVSRAQMNLFYEINASMLTESALECLGYTLLHKPFLTQSIQHVSLDGFNLCARNGTVFLLALDKPQLRGCTIRHLFPRGNAPSPDSVGKYAYNSLTDVAQRIQPIRKLSLVECGIRDGRSLVSFLDSFQSLSLLLITWVSPHPFTNQTFLPPTHPRHSHCQLLSLAIQIVPNVSTLLTFFVESRPLVSYLKYLMVSCSFSNLTSLLHEIGELLLHCSHSLQELTIVVGYFYEPNYTLEAGTP